MAHWDTLCYRQNDRHREAAALCDSGIHGRIAYRETISFAPEPTRAVLILAGTPHSSEIEAVYQKRGIPVQVLGEAGVLATTPERPVVRVVDPSVPPVVRSSPVKAPLRREPLESVVSQKILVALQQSSLADPSSIAEAGVDGLMRLRGVGRATAKKIVDWARG